MKKYYILIINEFRLYVNELRQYWFETLTSIIVMSAMFLALFYGLRNFSSLNDSQSLDSLIFGYLLWNFATSIYNAVTSNVTQDNQIGLLEQLYLAPVGYVQLIIARTIVHSFWGVVMATALTIIAMAATGKWISINYIYLYTLLLLAAPSIVGLGFLMCGMSLLFKRVTTITAVLQLIFIGLVSIRTSPFEPLSFLPFTAGASLATEVILNNHAINIEDLLFVLFISSAYLIAGIRIYKLFEKRAKHMNLIGQY